MAKSLAKLDLDLFYIIKITRALHVFEQHVKKNYDKYCGFLYILSLQIVQSLGQGLVIMR